MDTLIRRMADHTTLTITNPMSTEDTNDDGELTIDSLTKSKSDILSDFGLGDTALGRAAEKLEENEQQQANQREAIIRKRLLLEAAEKQLGGSDPDVEALRADIHDLSSDLEADALRAEHEGELEEVRDKIDNLEGLAQRAASQGQDRLEQNYLKRAASLKKDYPELEEEREPSLYERVEALIDDGDDDLEGDETAEALADFRDRQEVKELDENMDPADRKLLSNFKTLKSQATGAKTREMYEKKIKALRAKYTEE